MKKEEHIQIRIPRKKKEFWQAFAEVNGISLSELIRESVEAYLEGREYRPSLYPVDVVTRFTVELKEDRPYISGSQEYLEKEGEFVDIGNYSEFPFQEAMYNFLKRCRE